MSFLLWNDCFYNCLRQLSPHGLNPKVIINKMFIRVNLRLIVENNALLTSFKVWQQIVKLFILYGKYRKSIAFFIFIFTQQKCIFLETNKFEKKYFSGDKVVTTISCLQRHTRQQLRQSVGQTTVACLITAK